MTITAGYEEMSRSVTSHSCVLGEEYAGRTFRIYATQVLSDGRESPLSEAAVITIGDTICPPTPTGLARIDTTLVGSTVSVSVQWDAPPSTTDWEDLDHFVIYQWLNFSHLSDFSPEITIFESQVMDKAISSTADLSFIVNKHLNTFTISGTLISHNFYVGVQAVDSSGNASPINVLHLTAEYDASPALPDTYVVSAEQRALAIEVVIRQLPTNASLSSIKIFRDNETEVGSIAYPSGGGVVRFRDNVSDFANHYYTFSVVNTAGNSSSRSSISNAAAAKTVSTSDINAEELSAVFEANASSINSSLEEVQHNLQTQSSNIVTLSSSLSGAHNEISTVADSVTVLANQLSLLSAAVENIAGQAVTMGTEISQNAEEIRLRATYNEVDSATGEVTENLTAQIRTQANAISAVVTELNRSSCSYSAITQLKDAISLKVAKDGVVNAINLSPEEITIAGNKLHVSAGTVFDRDVVVKGSLEAANITIKNPDGSIAFGGPNVKSIPNMGFLSTGYAPIQIPPPGSYSGDIFDNLPWNTTYSLSFPVAGLGNKYAVLCCYISFDKRDNGVTAQARVYAKYGSSIFYGTITEVSFADFQNTEQSFLAIPSLPSGTWEIGVQTRRSSSTDGGYVGLKSADCQYFVVGA